MNGIVERRLAEILSRSWWRVLVRGVAAIVFGLLTWAQPGISLMALLMLFAFYAVVDGVLAIWTAIEGRKLDESWWVLLLGGLFGVGVGLLALVSPEITTVALLFYIAAWAIGGGLLEIVAAIRLRKEIEGEWAFILGGLISVGFGVLLMARPAAGVLAALALIGTYAVLFGILLVIVSLKVRSFGKQVGGRPMREARV